MFELHTSRATSKAEMYRELEAQIGALLAGERDWIANTANSAALIFTLPDLNWAGFYRLREGELVLGPSQGRPACIRIAVGRGVCGTAAQRRETVVPLVGDGRLLGVLDVDSPIPARFNDEDRAGLERLAEILVDASDTSP